MVLGFMNEILFTIVPQEPLAVIYDCVGMTRSTMIPFIFLIIHAIGNLQVLPSPDDFKDLL